MGKRPRAGDGIEFKKEHDEAKDSCGQGWAGSRGVGR